MRSWQEWTPRQRFYVLAVVTVVVTLVFVYSMEWIAHGSPASPNNPPMKPDNALDLYSTMSGLLVTLATALLGALGYLLMNMPKKESRPGRSASALGSALFAVLSIFFGYKAHLTALIYTSFNAFDPNTFNLIWPSRAQFYTLLLAVFFFADFAFHELGEGASDERP